MINAPKPKPSAYKNLCGNPGKRAINHSEPMPTNGAPVCPDWMPEDGRHEWDRIVPELDRLGMLTKIDGAVLEGHCATYSEFVRGVKSGEPLKATLLGQMRIFCAELGLTPSSRSRLSAPQKGDNAEIDFFFQ